MSWKQAGVNFIRMAVLLVLVSMAAFFLVSVSPLDPLTTNVGQAALGSMSQRADCQTPGILGRQHAACNPLSGLGR